MKGVIIMSSTPVFNLSSAITRIKLKLGLNAIVTPFPELNNVIKEIITTITIPVFSQYCPQKETVPINTKDLRIAHKGQNMTEYFLPNWKKECLEITDVRYSETEVAGLGFYTGHFPLFENGLMGAYMLSNVTSQLMQQMIPKFTFKYIKKGHRLQLYNAYYNSEMYLDINFVHDTSLASIPPTAVESFMQLALLDVKENLYPTLKAFNQIESAYGRIDLKIDNWENAEQERKELIDKWDDVYHLDYDQPFYFI